MITDHMTITINFFTQLMPIDFLEEFVILKTQLIYSPQNSVVQRPPVSPRFLESLIIFSDKKLGALTRKQIAVGIPTNHLELLALVSLSQRLKPPDTLRRTWPKRRQIA